MNAARRKLIDALDTDLSDIMDYLANALSAAQEILDEEQEYLDNMPENMRDGDKGQAADEAVTSLQAVVDALQDIDLDDARAELDTARG